MTLPARANRATNLVVASLYSPLLGVQRGRARSWRAWVFFYGLAIGVEVLDPGLHPALRLDLASNPAVPAGPATTDLRQDFDVGIRVKSYGVKPAAADTGPTVTS